MARGKNFQIESLRGLAVLLMVAGHVIGGDSESGMRVSQQSFWHFGFVGLEDIRMPLFTVLSGFVYAYRPLPSIQGYGRLVRGKARRLLVPLLTVGTTFYFIQAFTPGTNSKPEPSGFWRTYIFGHEHLWFVQAIFIVFLIVGVLDGTSILKRRTNFIAVFLIASVAFLFWEALPAEFALFSFHKALRLLPFFLLGYALHRYPPVRAGRLLMVTLSLFIVVFGLRVLELSGAFSAPPWPMSALHSYLIGMTACTGIMLAKDVVYVRPLAWLGQFAFGIYLLHVFGSAASRMLLNKLGVEGNFVVFVVGMIAAVGVPIAFEMTVGRISWVSWAILGQRAWKPSSFPPCLSTLRNSADEQKTNPTPVSAR